MWENRTSTPAAPPAPKPAAAAPALSPYRHETPAKGTAIGSAISIVGDIYSEEDLYIDGHVKGSLEVRNGNITVGPNGRAESNLKAREVVILGQVKGDVDAAARTTIRKKGSLVGNIRTTGIVIDDEAYFKGGIEILQKPKDPAAA